MKPVTKIRRTMNVQELMAKTGWSKQEIYKKTSAGLLPYYKPFGKTIFFDESEIDEVLLSNRHKTMREVKSEAMTFAIQKNGAV